ncbi:MAG: protoheme IX farnesyltransferase [Deltaproteobacteria bacterium CG11_big_fil_rev_8_21_14_0_20_45_16]|nr:MAG: protoheme IX farnesyltransferase [Deltaproteobacteria bacterium CG11_big_fil_rev_8_21_14_0_20_45_16]
MSAFANYLQLTKPSIIALVVITALGALAAEGSLFSSPGQMALIALAIAMAAGSANAFNQFIDRDIDSVMERTKRKRPLPMGKIKPWQAFVFASVIGVVSTIYLYLSWGFLAAAVSVATILFYTLVYTIGLKRRHHYNIVIGGAAGAAGPLIAWAAVEGNISAFAWILFLIIFMWTPAHFWALALAIKDEYQQVSVPMLPVTHGETRTRNEIIFYTLSLLPISFLPYYYGWTTWVYGAGALALWIWYMWETYKKMKQASKEGYMKLFYVSIFYLFFLFLVVGVDGAIRFYNLI